MSVEESLVLAYLALNLLTFLAFLWDKKAARWEHRRIEERSLLLLSLAGPFGAMAGMRLFHHKSRKRKFLLVPLFLLLHVAIFLAIGSRLL